MYYLIILLIVGLPLIAQITIISSYANYKKIKTSKGLTGERVARIILDNNNLHNVKIEKVEGDLTDHYDPRKKVVRLSSDIYNGNSIASISVAAHECGHAVQDSKGYVPLKIRSALVPTVNLTTNISYYIILIGFILEIVNLVYIGIAFTSIGLLFQLITLPVEFNASRRGIKFLEDYNIIDKSEISGSKVVLASAAFTYVAGALSSILQVLRYILLVQNRD